MSKIKHTKNELKRQKDFLKRFTRYLPTLQLKKKQLQAEVLKILHDIEVLESDIEAAKEAVSEWIGVFAEDVGIEAVIKQGEIHTVTGNIAGIDIPIFEKIDFEIKEYPFLKTPLWVDYGITEIKKHAQLRARLAVLNKQLKLVREELRITAQRVNLFEKIKIPETLENIRRIRIFLGDLETASVVTGKIAKSQMQAKRKEAVLQ